MKQRDCDVIVVGGGHAGCEAAHAAARTGADVILVTMKRADLGTLSCNPAIGGLGKGHLVREIDAMGGLMARIADGAGIQFRLLNRRRGPAVQGPRAQVGRALYARGMTSAIEVTPGIRLVEGEVSDLFIENGMICGVCLRDDAVLRSGAVILTTGTFLGGRILRGSEQWQAGRAGSSSSQALAERLRAMGLVTGRLKTGTPPRLNGRTIDWSRISRQESDEEPVFLSFQTKEVASPQVSCGITHTNPKTHDIIERNLHCSAMYQAEMVIKGPRYCPSIEDKILRFAGKDAHQIFLEPECTETDVVYPNGISTSLSPEVQTQFVRSIDGLEDCEVLCPGYAIEYDYCDPRNLHDTLSLKDLPGLFMAGQINGTTGYEEAAAQGLVAGLNAVRHITNGPPIRFDRASCYVGVMVDDLITRGVTEPYRMFTSRAEYRLSLRADNADQRLTPLAIEIGCIGKALGASFRRKAAKLTDARTRLKGVVTTSAELASAGVPVGNGKARSAYEVLGLPEMTYDILMKIKSDIGDLAIGIKKQIEREAIYENYIERQARDVEVLRRDQSIKVPYSLRFGDLDGLSSELKQKLDRIRPENLAQAMSIEGMTPAAGVLLLAAIRRHQRVSPSV